MVELSRPDASTATKVTSASPIINAAAVAAVLDGLRPELAEASRPIEPPSRRAGTPTTRISGATRRLEIIATPMKSSSIPPAAGTSTAFAPPPERTPAAIASTASTITTPAT